MFGVAVKTQKYQVEMADLQFVFIQELTDLFLNIPDAAGLIDRPNIPDPGIILRVRPFGQKKK